MVVCFFNSRTQEAKAGGVLWVQGQQGLHREFPDSQDCIVKLCLQNKANPYKLKVKITLKSHVCKYIYKCTDLFVIQSVHYSGLNMILLLLKTSRFSVHDIQLRLLDLA